MDESNMKIEGISKKYKNKVILNEVSLSADKGTCIGILGGNGSGKSTLLSILAGVQRPDAGSVLWGKEDLLQNRKLREQLVGYVPQGNPLFEELTAWDNLRLWYGKKELEKELSEGILASLEIDSFIDVPVRKMSGGMKKRLSIGCSVANHPEVLLLDEPSAALDLICKESIYRYIEKFKQEGGRVLLATHEVTEVALCDECYILSDGTLTPYQYDGDVHRLVQLLQGIKENEVG